MCWNKTGLVLKSFLAGCSCSTKCSTQPETMEERFPMTIRENHARYSWTGFPRWTKNSEEEAMVTRLMRGRKNHCSDPRLDARRPACWRLWEDQSSRPPPLRPQPACQRHLRLRTPCWSFPPLKCAFKLPHCGELSRVVTVTGTSSRSDRVRCGND
ncbi:hypothetical protein EDB84DRAFT_1450342, partial [Lactarius hengduanensis]